MNYSGYNSVSYFFEFRFDISWKKHTFADNTFNNIQTGTIY